MPEGERQGVAAYCGFDQADASVQDPELKKLRGVFRAIVGTQDRPRFPGLNDITALMLLSYISPKRTRGEARRHVLLEGAPGTAKSELTKAIGKALMEFGKERREAGYLRIQGTPDLLPANFTGSELRKSGSNFQFVKGPLVQDTSILHVDEINRISSRTLAVLFEAMAEAQVTLTSLLVDPDERQCDLEWLFVVGTQNPASFIGTNLLPEPLLDRFMVRAVMPYPDKRLLSELILSLEDDRPAEAAPPQPPSNKLELVGVPVQLRGAEDSLPVSTPGKGLPSDLILSLENDRPAEAAPPQPPSNKPDVVGVAVQLRGADAAPIRGRRKKVVDEQSKVDFGAIRGQTGRLVGGLLGHDDHGPRRNKTIADDIAAVLLASWPSETAGSIPDLRRQLPVERRLRALVDTSLDHGLGVRAGQSLRDLASAVAWCRSGGRVDADVTREDVALIAPYVLGHRLRFKPGTFRTPDEQMAFVERFLNLAWQWQDSL
jgi:MoxR-like ATPase